MGDVMKTIKKYMKQYQYDLCLNYLEKQQPKLINRDAIDFMIYILKGIQEDKLPKECILSYLNYCNFDKVEVDRDIFFQCLYHILNNLFIKGYFEDLSSLKHILIPEFIKTELSEVHREYYKSTISLIVQHSVVSELEKRKSVYPKRFLDMCFLTLDMKFAYNQKNPTYLAKELEKHIMYLMNAKISHSIIIDKFNEYVYEISDKFLQYKSALSLITLLLKSCTSVEEKQKLCTDFFATIKKTGDETSVLLIELAVNIFINASEDLDLGLRALNNLLRGCDMTNKYIVESCQYIVYILTSTMQIGSQVEHSWNSKVTKDIVLQYSNFANQMEIILMNMKRKCCCELNYRADDATLILLGVGIGKKFLSDPHVYKIILNNLNQITKHLVKLKECKCNKFKIYWLKSVTVYYNIAIDMHKTQVNGCADYFKSLFQTMTTIEGNGEKETKTRQHNIMELFIDACNKKGDYEMACNVSAMSFYLFRSDDTLTNFVKYKNKLDGSNKIRNVVNVLQANEKLYRSFYKDFKSINSDQDKIDMLLLEVKCYLKIWPSRKVLICVFKELYSLMDPVKFVDHMTDLPMEYLIIEEPEFYKIICNCLESIKSEKKLNFQISYLYFFKFRYENIVQTYKNEKEIAKMKDVEPLEAQHPAEEVLHVNDTCDIVSCYSDLKISNYSKVLKYLYVCLEHLKKAVKKQEDAKESFVSLAKSLGHMFNLHGFPLEALQSWQLASEVAQKMNLPKLYTEVASAMLFYLNASSKRFKEINKIIKSYIAEISNETACFYYTNLAFSYLNNGDLEECLKAHELANEKYFSIQDVQTKTTELSVIKIFFNFLESHIYNFPCDYNIYKHGNYVQVKPLTTFKLIQADLKMITYNMEITPQFLTLLFDITEYIVSNFNRLRFPRDARCYGRELVQLAQKVVVPFRTARLLILLAKADLLTSRFSDCQVKSNGVSDILDLKKIKAETPNIMVSNDDSGDNLKISEYPINAASPILYKESLIKLAFLNHEDCCCIQCRSTEYHELLLKNIHLEAMVNERTGNILISQNYFDNLNEMKTKIQRINAKRMECFEFELNDKVKTLQQTLEFIAVDHIKWSLRNENAANETLANMQESKNHHLNYEIYHIQNSHLINWNDYFDKLNFVKSLPPMSSNIGGARTPDNQVSKIKFPKSVSPCKPPGSVPHNKNIKKTLFAFDQFSVPKTPTAKFQIYTPTVKESKKKIKSETKSAAKIKMLADKMKSSLKVNDENEPESNDNASTSRPRRNVRKNLLDEMSATPTIKTSTVNSREGLRRLAKRDR